MCVLRRGEKHRVGSVWALTVKAGLHVRRKHKHKRAFLLRALVLASSRFTRGLSLRLCLGRTCKPAFSSTMFKQLRGIWGNEAWRGAREKKNTRRLFCLVLWTSANGNAGCGSWSGMRAAPPHLLLDFELQLLRRRLQRFVAGGQAHLPLPAARTEITQPGTAARSTTSEPHLDTIYVNTSAPKAWGMRAHKKRVEGWARAHRLPEHRARSLGTNCNCRVRVASV